VRRFVLALAGAAALAAPAAVRAAPETDPPVVPAEPVEEAGPDVRKQAAERLGLRVDEGVPIDISADELEAVRDADGAERVIFRGNVRVVQGSLHMRAERIEVVYRKGGGGRPGRIEATRKVRIEQDGAEAECARAVFEEALGRITCSDESGQATLRRDGDTLRGERIEFDLRKGVLKVHGRARVRIQPREPDAERDEPPPVAESQGNTQG
jgi:lipopolysaccharide export system protein LptA